jgi:hypothetical protein
MKTRLACAAALVFAQFAATSALAEQTATQFRTAEPQSFTAAELERYGLSAADVERAVGVQEDGYRLMVLTSEEAEAYTAGVTDSQWIMLGILAGVIVIAVAVSD